MPLVEVDAIDDALHALIYGGVFKDDVCCFASEFQRETGRAAG